MQVRKLDQNYSSKIMRLDQIQPGDPFRIAEACDLTSQLEAYAFDEDDWYLCTSHENMKKQTVTCILLSTGVLQDLWYDTKVILGKGYIALDDCRNPSGDGE